MIIISIKWSTSVRVLFGSVLFGVVKCFWGKERKGKELREIKCNKKRLHFLSLPITKLYVKHFFHSDLVEFWCSPCSSPFSFSAALCCCCCCLGCLPRIELQLTIRYTHITPNKTRERSMRLSDATNVTHFNWFEFSIQTISLSNVFPIEKSQNGQLSYLGWTQIRLPFEGT